MKMLIHTQYKENYGAHCWNGEGECPQHWKYKGGYVYIVNDVTIPQARSAEFWDKAMERVSYKDNYAEEYVVDCYLAEDADFDITKYSDHWEHPTQFNANDLEV